MRDFNQASLDEHLASLAQNLTPEQAEQVKERVQQKVSAGGFDYTPGAIDGAFNLVGAVLNGAVSVPGNLGGVGDRLAGLLGALDPRHLGSGIGNLLGHAPDLGGAIGDVAGHAGDAVGAVVDLAGGAAGAVDALGSVVEVAGSAGELAGIVLEALGDVLGSLDF
jgi:hypothetical protein